MIRPECNCLKSLMGYLRRESAPTPNPICVTFYFLVRNLISLKNINTINSSFLLYRGFYVEHRGCTEWLKQINLSILLMLTLHLKISKMVKIQIVKISDISDMINWNLFMFLIYVTPYSGSCICDDIEVSQELGALFSSSVSFPCISPLACSVRPQLCVWFTRFVHASSYIAESTMKNW